MHVGPYIVVHYRDVLRLRCQTCRDPSTSPERICSKLTFLKFHTVRDLVIVCNVTHVCMVVPTSKLCTLISGLLTKLNIYFRRAGYTHMDTFYTWALDKSQSSLCILQCSNLTVFFNLVSPFTVRLAMIVLQFKQMGFTLSTEHVKLPFTLTAIHSSVQARELTPAYTWHAATDPGPSAWLHLLLPSTLHPAPWLQLMLHPGCS